MLSYYDVAEKRLSYRNGMTAICLVIQKSIIHGRSLIILQRDADHRHIGQIQVRMRYLRMFCGKQQMILQKDCLHFLQGETVLACINQNVVYRSLTEEPANVYSLLMVAGYLKAVKKELQPDGAFMCQISIPNKEIAAVYKGEVLSHLLQVGLITQSTANKIAESLYVNDMAKLQTAIMEYMKKTISFYDAGAEGFYHGLLLGLMALLDNQYKIRSNREAGEGRYDIGLIPKEKKYPGIIMELKWARDAFREGITKSFGKGISTD